MKSIQVLAHGKLKNNSVFEGIVKVFKDNFENVDIKFSLYKGHMKELANLINSENLMVAGGDGTFHEVINGLMESGHSPQIFLVPLGSGNDFSRSIQINAESYLSHSDLLNWKTSETDILKASFLNEKDRSVRYSLNISDVGIGGEVAQWLHKIPDFLGVTLKYNLAVLLGFFRYRRKKFIVNSNEVKLESTMLSLCMGNGRYFANGMCICPHAIHNDGKMSISIFKNLSILDYLKYLPKIKKGIKIEHSEVDYWLTDSIKIESEEPSPIDMDGELGGFTPVTFEIIPKTLKIMLPS